MNRFTPVFQIAQYLGPIVAAGMSYGRLGAWIQE